MAYFETLFSGIPVWVVIAGMAVLGAIWGSFIGALCDRWPKGEGVSKGRSRCDSCGATLTARELVPLLSYLLQRGRCRHCQAEIGASRFWIEIAAAMAGMIAALVFAGPAILVAAVFFWLLLPLAVLDWRHLWLPDSLVTALAICGLLLGGYLFDAPLDDRLFGAVGGFAVLSLLRFGFARVRGIEGMGAGDPKLMGAIGLWLGWLPLPTLLLIASAIGLGHYLVSGRSEAVEPTQFPLGTYLCAAAALLPMAIAVS